MIWSIIVTDCWGRRCLFPLSPVDLVICHSPLPQIPTTEGNKTIQNICFPEIRFGGTFQAASWTGEVRKLHSVNAYTSACRNTPWDQSQLLHDSLLISKKIELIIVYFVKTSYNMVFLNNEYARCLKKRYLNFCLLLINSVTFIHCNAFWTFPSYRRSLSRTK